LDGLIRLHMESHRSQFVLKLLPSFADFAFLMPIAFLFGRMDGLRTLFGDCDTGWHIRTGEWVVANRWVPARDIFSFSKPGQPWFAWEWLSDVAFAWIHSSGGLRALAIFAIVLIAATFCLLFRLVRRKANVIVAIVITMVAAAASSIHWLARPHLFTLLFLTLFYSALEATREGRTRLAGIPYLAVLPLATVLWTNLHGGFFVGILMICAYGTGELLNMLFSADTGDRSRQWRVARAYFLSAAACLAASLINPYFYHLHVHMVQYLRNPWNSQHIMEFLSPSFHHPASLFFEGMLVLGVCSAVWHLSKGRFIEPILIAMWAHAALLAARNIPIFMIAAAPPVAAAIQEWLECTPEWNVAGWLRKAILKFNHIAAETGEMEAVGRWHLVSVAGLLLVAATVWAPNPPKKFRAEFDPDRYPAKAVAMLKHEAPARIFTFDQWGDYLIFSLYPKNKVFVDGRSDFYGNDFEEKYIDVLNVKYGWEKTLGRFGVDTILMPPDAPLTGALKESRRWRVVYDDGIALIFRSVDKTNGQRPAAGTTVSFSLPGEGSGRDREVTKTQASDRAITKVTYIS
jgi:hypothetical protein